LVDVTSHELATWLRRFHVNQCRHDPALIVEDRLIGDAFLTLDPARVTPYPSSNRNLAAFLGHEADVTAGIVCAIVGRFGAAGVSRFFVWLSPGPQLSATVGTLESCGLRRFGGTSYPKMVRDLAEPIAERPTTFAIRAVDPSNDVIAESLPADSRRTLGIAGYDHFVALDGTALAASAFCYTADGVVYLGGAHTVEAYRNRGAQSALIAARLNRGIQHGAHVAVSETLAMLKTSLANLERARFRHVYDELVYQWPGG
jgi:hypothetical protein